jgi:hypothetical protein
VSQTFAAKHFPQGDAVGRHLKGGDRDAAAAWITIVGVVGDVPYERGIWGGLAPTVYLPRAQNAASRSRALQRHSQGWPALPYLLPGALELVASTRGVIL